MHLSSAQTMDLILSIEEARRRKRMSQTEIARELAVTQGHYSKVVASKTKLSEKLATRMEGWLTRTSQASVGNDATRRIYELAASIRSECMELMHLTRLAEIDVPDSCD